MRRRLADTLLPDPSTRACLPDIAYADAAERSDGACAGESVAAEGLTAERLRAAAVTRPLSGLKHTSGPGQARQA